MTIEDQAAGNQDVGRLPRGPGVGGRGAADGSQCDGEGAEPEGRPGDGVSRNAELDHQDCTLSCHAGSGAPQREGAAGCSRPSTRRTPPAWSSRSQIGPSRSTNSACRATCHAGAIASEGQIMQPTITPNPCACAACSNCSASVRPPLLSSLMLTTW